MADEAEAAVKVAVRVRPFNGREKAMNAPLAIEMEGKKTTVYEEDVNETEKEGRDFSFDYSLWSHFDMANEDGGDDPEHPDRPKVDQQVLYDTIGKVLLDAFWEGYDVCMFAYGQSGSGKSFSMTGTGPKCPAKWKGAIPRICADTFAQAAVQEAADENVKFTVTASMLEIYIGQIYDLLIPADVYDINTRLVLDMQLDDVKGLGWLPVKTEDDVTDLLVLGFGNQTKAPTGLNVDSSRGHTVFTLKMEKNITNPKAKKKKDRVQVITTNMKLVDLAGSERTEKVLEITSDQLAALLTEKYGKPMTVSDKMMATYKEERTKEGRSINNSLTTLGNCVQQVAKLSEIEDLNERKKKMEQIAWRSASLTRLLKSALNGKCKTMMVAAISPSCTEYPETISTMRYANQIKQIKSMAVKKEAKQTQEQINAEKIKKLEELLANALKGGGGGGGGGVDPEEIKKLAAAMAEVKADMARAKKEAEDMAKKMAQLKEASAGRADLQSGPHLMAILNIPMTVGLYPSALPDGKETVAGKMTQDDVQIKLRGDGVKKYHARFTTKGNEVTFVPVKGAPCILNGSACTDEKPYVLKHNDRLRLGEHNYFRFICPSDMEKLSPEEREKDEAKYDFEFLKKESMKEMLAAFNIDDGESSKQKEFEEALKKREEEAAKLHAEQEALKKAEEAEHEDALKKLQAEMERQMKEAHEKALAHAGSDEEKLKVLEEKAKREKEMTEKLKKQKAEFEEKMLGQQRMLAQKLEEEDAYRKQMIKDEEKAQAKRANMKEKMQYDLIDAIPLARQACQYAKEMDINSHFTVKVVVEQNQQHGMCNEVCVMLTDNDTDETETWHMDVFRKKYGIIMQEYHDNKKNMKEGKPVKLGPNTGFHVSETNQAIIGYAKVLLNFIYYNMEINDAFHIMDTTGKPGGTVTISMQPLWATEQQEAEAVEAETIHDIKSLKFLDLEVNVVKCTGLPNALAHDVVVSFSFPTFVETSILSEDKSEGKGGATLFETPVNPATTGKLVLNPEIGWKRIIRLHNMSYKVREWLKTGDLIVTVKGSTAKTDPALLKKKREAAKGGAKKKVVKKVVKKDKGDAKPLTAAEKKELEALKKENASQSAFLAELKSQLEEDEDTSDDDVLYTKTEDELKPILTHTEEKLTAVAEKKKNDKELKSLPDIEKKAAAAAKKVADAEAKMKKAEEEKEKIEKSMQAMEGSDPYAAIERDLASLKMRHEKLAAQPKSKACIIS